jgi:hypothetical protein
MRRLAATAAVLASLAAAAVASGDQAPIPIEAPTGYRDYCDRIGRNRVCPRGGVPQGLWRPLALPKVASGAACPVSRSRTGPVYATHVNPWRVPLPAPENSLATGSGWAVDKTPFLMKKSFRGPFAVRGRQIDGPGEIGFSGPGGRRPFEAMQFAFDRWGLTAANGERGWGVIVWMTSPGCYAFQIDGVTFSRVIVFRVEFVTA